MPFDKADHDLVADRGRRASDDFRHPVEDAFAVIRFPGQDVIVPVADVAPEQSGCRANELSETAVEGNRVLKDAVFRLGKVIAQPAHEAETRVEQLLFVVGVHAPLGLWWCILFPVMPVETKAADDLGIWCLALVL